MEEDTDPEEEIDPHDVDFWNLIDAQEEDDLESFIEEQEARIFLDRMHEHLTEQEIRDIVFDQVTFTTILLRFWNEMTALYPDIADLVYDYTAEVANTTNVFLAIESTVDIYPALSYTKRLANATIIGIKNILNLFIREE